MGSTRKKLKKNMIKDEEKRHIRSNPITKGVDTSIAMGIDTTDTPLPLQFLENKDDKK